MFNSPDNPMIRPFQAADADALGTILSASFEAGELKGSTRADVAFWHTRLPSDPEGTLVAVVGGQVAGLITPQHEQIVVGQTFRRRGIGTRLVLAAEDLLRSRGTGPLFLALPHENGGASAFLDALGFRYHHSLWRMRLRNDAAVPRPNFPASVVRHPYRDDEVAAFTDLVNTAFLDHPTPWSVNVEQVRYIHAQPGFNPDNLCLLSPATAPNELVAFCRVVPGDDEARPTAHISILGVLRAWRGQGLGRELLRWSVFRARELGAVDIFLAVEGENEQALHLYEGTGFERVEEWPRYGRSIRSDRGVA